MQKECENYTFRFLLVSSESPSHIIHENLQSLYESFSVHHPHHDLGNIVTSV